MKEFWNQRYREDEFAYGKEPNLYFKEKLESLPAGKILMPAEGEGRNAVYAAKLGWQVFAYDFSDAAYSKAMRLAEENRVSISYQVCSLRDLDFPSEYFDAIGLVYAHFPDEIRTANHRKLVRMLKPGGTLILEAFSTNHPVYQAKNPDVGGPKLSVQLYNSDKLSLDFSDLEILECREVIVELSEGRYHKGEAAVMRFVGKKK
jgi:SAM-dependent methyltransferase